MRTRALVGLTLGALLFAPPARPREKPEYDGAKAVMGSNSYKTYCAVCHGKEARGDGPLASQLRFAPPDLTTLTKRNRGTFPFDKVVQIIDGRKDVKGHGGTDMPVWGDAFLESREGYDAERVRQKIEELAHFLWSRQPE